jgi:hypothetical protein
MAANTFENLIIIGRPAAGKSEVIDFLKKCSDEERARRFHIGTFEEIDDFVFVWECFEIDDIYSKHGRPRKFTDTKYYFNEHFVWNMFLERINLEYAKKLAYNPGYHETHTALIEFARGGDDGFREALGYLSDELLGRSRLMYIKVPYEESVRKNRKRARKGQEDSILFHSLPDDKMDFYYKVNDWDAIEAADPRYITVRDHKIPYTVFDNMPEKTGDPALLGPELERALQHLWGIAKP